LTVTFTQLSDPETFEDSRKLISNLQFDEPPTYFEVAFTTIPGVTGFILLGAVIIMFFTSLE